jgi:hypothetical protein
MNVCFMQSFVMGDLWFLWKCVTMMLLSVWFLHGTKVCACVGW